MPKFISRIREFILLPSKVQWKSWKLLSKMTTVGFVLTVLGFPLTVAGLVLTIYALLPSNDAKRVEVENTISVLSSQVRAAESIESNFTPTSDFTSQARVLSELDRFNEYIHQTSGALDDAMAFRLFKEYGSKEQQAKLKQEINQVHDTGLAVTNFLTSLANSSGPKTMAEETDLVSKYVALLNQEKLAESGLNGFLTGVSPKYFGL